jgi:C4-dicarboxylate-binding protein DctP
MNPTRRKLALAMLAAAIPRTARGAAVAPINMRFSVGAREDSARSRAAKAFKELVEARTHGRVQVDLFLEGSLYAQRDELEALQLGAVQVVAPTFYTLAVLGLTDFEAFELPYLFDSYEAVHRVTDGPVGARLLGELKDKGIEGFAFWDVGFKQMTAQRPLHAPEDVRGLSIKTTYTRVSDVTLRALGAVPKPMSLSETRDAVTSGVVNGAELPTPLIDVGRLDEFQAYLTLTNHGYLGSALLMNRRFWERLSGEIRAGIAAAAREATDFANAAAQKENADALAALKTRGRIAIVGLSAAERQRWKRALMAVHRDSAVRIPPQTLRAMYDAAGFAAE